MVLRANIFVLVVPCIISFTCGVALPRGYTALGSEEGVQLLQDAYGLNESFIPVSVNLETQYTQSFCGVATAVTLLNSMPSKNSAPVDPLLKPFKFFTQTDIFSTACASSVKTSDPSIPFSPFYVATHGATIVELNDLIECYADSEIIFGADLTLEKFREVIKTTMNTTAFVGVDIDRSAMGGRGGGHFSPIGAYNEKADVILFMDVARYKYDPAWIPTELMLKGMQTIDPAMNNSRGLIIVHPDDGAKSQWQEPSPSTTVNFSALRECVYRNRHQDDYSLDVFLECWRDVDYDGDEPPWIHMFFAALLSAIVASTVTFFLMKQYSRQRDYISID